MSEATSASMRVSMVAPTRIQCGIVDYTTYLVAALNGQVDVCGVYDPARYPSAEDDADIVHIQHQYFFFGGVAPWKNRFAAFAKSLRKPAVMTAHEFVEPSGPPHVRAAIRITN